MRERYPRESAGEADRIACWTCRKHSGHVGRSAAARALDAGTVDLAVRAHVRHQHIDYEDRLRAGAARAEARDAVEEPIDAVIVSRRAAP